MTYLRLRNNLLKKQRCFTILALSKRKEYGACHNPPYIYHAPAGRALLEHEGLERHALVAERHIGLGITREENYTAMFRFRRDMLCESLEEKIICWADLFFSKTPERLWQEKSLAQVEQRATRYGLAQPALFREWCWPQ